MRGPSTGAAPIAAPGCASGPAGSTTVSPVGSKGKKPRKPQHSQHLPKAGTRADTERLMHEEHGAILDTFGMGNAGKGARSAVWVIGTLLLIGAVVALVILTVALS
jgi:hypothetical protein